MDSNKTKIAIVVLSRGYNTIEKYTDLIERNVSIYDLFYNKINQKFDVIVFHEGNINMEHQLYISKFTPKLNIIFKNIKKTPPKVAFDDSKNKINYSICPPTPLSNSFPLGYKHMCHFWAIDFLQYLKEYKYIVRIDEDCVIKKFDNNVFQKMMDNNIKYISPFFQEQDKKDVIVGLETILKDFTLKNNITPKIKFEDIKCPYTNFMIFDVEYFINENVINNFLKCVDDSHGIYSNRWGDLPIWGVILSTFLNPSSYLEDKSISYYHKSHNKLIN